MSATFSAFSFTPLRDPIALRRSLGPAGHRNRLSSRKCRLYRHRFSGLNWRAARMIMCNQVKVDDDVDDETCELVNGVDLTIGEGEDSIHAYLLNAVKNNNETGVLLLSDVYGFEDSSTRDFAYRVACNGYKCILWNANHMCDGWWEKVKSYGLICKAPANTGSGKDQDICSLDTVL